MRVVYVTNKLVYHLVNNKNKFLCGCKIDLSKTYIADVNVDAINHYNQSCVVCRAIYNGIHKNIDLMLSELCSHGMISSDVRRSKNTKRVIENLI